MTYYEKHVFFCTNKRDSGKACCEDKDATAHFSYAKARVKALGLSGKNRIRINKAGCLDRCSEGPVLVIYPEGVWYTYHNEEDIEEILQKAVLRNEPVKRLLLKE